MTSEQTEPRGQLVPVPAAGLAGGVIVHTRRERERAARTWLLLAADDAERARREWDETGIALLRCGALLAAVRIERHAVTNLAGTQDEEEIAGLLAAAFEGGPVFLDRHAARYYALVPASTGRQPEWAKQRHRRVAEFLGTGTYLGVPRTDASEAYGRRSYWTVPMHGPGALCSPYAVSQFVTLAGQRLAGLEGSPGER